MTPKHTALVERLRYEKRDCAGSWMSLMTGLCEEAAVAITALAGEVERLNEKLPCGHRKVDMSDSYGGCVLCQYKDGYHEYEEAVEALRAELEAEKAAHWRTCQTAAHEAEERDKLQAEVAAQQAKIDALMIEYCHEEMTGEQLANWSKHQVPATAEEHTAIDAALADKQKET